MPYAVVAIGSFKPFCAALNILISSLKIFSLVLFKFKHLSYSTNSFRTLAMSAIEALGLVNLFLIAASLHTLSMPALLETLTTRACGRNSGNKALQTLIVPVKFILIVCTACCAKGVGSAFYANIFISKLSIIKSQRISD